MAGTTYGYINTSKIITVETQSIILLIRVDEGFAQYVPGLHSLGCGVL